MPQHAMILVTGGTGYIGSHTCVALMNAGYHVAILDNLCNSRIAVLNRLARLCPVRPDFVEGEVRDPSVLDSVFARYPISAVVHFAGLKAVGDSVKNPLAYYDNNVNGSVQLLRAMQRANVKTFVFSSTATVYAGPFDEALRESDRLGASQPYGHSKLVVEEILADLQSAEPDWRIACLRYFNPVGAHESGLIGESPLGAPNNLMPYLAQVASGMREFLNVWGNDYATPDGTGVRDYLHVMDLAEAHLAALHHLQTVTSLSTKPLTLNLGTGQGYSVLEVVHAFEQASGQKIARQFAPRRAGDIAQYWADPGLAKQVLGWQAKRGLQEMCADTWRWQLHSAKDGEPS